ncbi:MAG: hypothetical protein IKI72_04580 [Bacteroidales bacterium]|nr:hypothetical protein [Bacteroidales bacterium]
MDILSLKMAKVGLIALIRNLRFLFFADGKMLNFARQDGGGVFPGA